MDAKTMGELLAKLEERFKSGNEVPVERIHITRKEFEALRQLAKGPQP